MASRPSTAQRVGTTSDAVCSQGGENEAGHPGAAQHHHDQRGDDGEAAGGSGVLPTAAMKSPKLAVMMAKARVISAKPAMLPRMRTPKMAMAAAKYRNHQHRRQ